jgi:signal transduction histidine kinase
MSVPGGLVPRRNDVLLAVALIGVSQLEVWGYGAAGGSMAAALTLGLAAAALSYRRLHPVLTTAVVALGLLLCSRFAGEPFSATSVLTFTIGFFSIGAMPQRRLSVAALLVGLALSGFAVQPLTLNDYLAITLTSIGLPWLLGLLWLRRRSGRQQVDARRQAAAEAVAAERLRLAQELHDVVSHNVGMIAVQAGAADVLLEKDPERTRESLHAIEEGARATLLELRRMLGLLRQDDPDPRTQRTTLAELPLLIEPVRRSGVDVTLETRGNPAPLSREVEVTAYRIVQEALTNVVAHAGRCRTVVTLSYSAANLGVEVTDDGVAHEGTTGGGYGLAGIRERVASLGGTVTAGPRAGDGFTVRALLPRTAR